MRTLLICHHRANLDRHVLVRWLASFSELSGIVILREPPGRVMRRVRKELRRVGAARFVDVLAFRLYYKLFLSRRDERWKEGRLKELCTKYVEAPTAPVLYTHSPNSAEAEEFIRNLSPDIVLARCKTLLKERVFSLAATGTFAMHPGICPEYRNAHGCFWALSNGDLTKVGMTLLRIDKGVDTGPIFGHFSCDYDELSESHAVIQERVVLDNLDALSGRLQEIFDGRAEPLMLGERESATWGQPWLTSYLRWKRRARMQRRRGVTA